MNEQKSCCCFFVTKKREKDVYECVVHVPFLCEGNWRTHIRARIPYMQSVWTKTVIIIETKMFFRNKY